MTQLFEERVKSTLARVTSIFNERGTQYGDSWRDSQFLALKAVAKHLGIKLEHDHCRAIAAAALYDTKYQRLQGGYKEDSIDDGINYAGFLAAEMRALESDGLRRGSVSTPRPRRKHAQGVQGGNATG